MDDTKIMARLRAQQKEIKKKLKRERFNNFPPKLQELIIEKAQEGRSIKEPALTALEQFYNEH